jgi:hypothetical protein
MVSIFIEPSLRVERRLWPSEVTAFYPSHGSM